LDEEAKERVKRFLRLILHLRVLEKRRGVHFLRRRRAHFMRV
jgi:hypothetical protein